MATARDREFEELTQEVKLIKANQDRWENTRNRWLVPLTLFTLGLVVNAVFSWSATQSDTKLLNYRLGQIEISISEQKARDRAALDEMLKLNQAKQEERYEEFKKKLGQ